MQQRNCVAERPIAGQESGKAKNIFMVVFIVLWPYLLTTKLRSVIRHNLGHSIDEVAKVLQEKNQQVVFGNQNQFLFMRKKTKVKVHLQNV